MTADQVRDLVEPFVAALLDRGRRPSTAAQYRRVLRDQAPAIAAAAAAAARNPGDALLASWRDLAPRTRIQYRSAVSTWSKWCHARGLLRADFFAELPSIKVDAPAPRPLSPGQAATLDRVARAHARGRVAALYWLLRHLGLRIGEPCLITVGRCDLISRVPTVTVPNASKGRRARTLPIEAASDDGAALLRTLRPLVQGRESADYVLRPLRFSIHGVSESWCSSQYRTIADLAGFEGVYREARRLRHTRATALARRGMHLVDLCAYMGWASISTAEHYVAARDLADALHLQP